MQEYIYKIEAVQWTGNNIEEIKKFLNNENIEIYDFETQKNALRIIDANDQDIKLGSNCVFLNGYIIKTKNNVSRCFEKEYFENMIL